MKINEAALKRLLEEKKNTEQTTPTPEKTYMGMTESEYADAVKGVLDNMPVRNPFGGFFGQKTQTTPTTPNVTEEQAKARASLFDPYSTSTGIEAALQKKEVVEPITEEKPEIKGVPNTISNDAMEYIREQIEALGPQRNTQIGDLINEYINRADFKYDPNADMLYQNYLAAMQNVGQMAMRDTMGQAAMLTGGYGSSYATAAANGAYNSYLQKANEALPDYYNIAANAYDRQGNDLLSQIQLLQNQDDEAYSRWLDQMKLASGNASTGETTADTMTATQENTVMSSALKTWIESNGNESELNKLLDGMSGYNLSDDFRRKVRDYIDQHSSKITKTKGKYSDGTNTYTYKELMDSFGDYFTDEQKDKIKRLKEGKWLIF